MKFIGVLQIVWLAAVTCLLVLVGFSVAIGTSAQRIALIAAWDNLAGALFPSIPIAFAPWALGFVTFGVAVLPYFLLDAVKKKLASAKI